MKKKPFTDLILSPSSRKKIPTHFYGLFFTACQYALSSVILLFYSRHYGPELMGIVVHYSLPILIISAIGDFQLEKLILTGKMPEDKVAFGVIGLEWSLMLVAFLGWIFIEHDNNQAFIVKLLALVYLFSGGLSRLKFYALYQGEIKTYYIVPFLLFLAVLVFSGVAFYKNLGLLAVVLIRFCLLIFEAIYFALHVKFNFKLIYLKQSLYFVIKETKFIWPLYIATLIVFFSWNIDYIIVAKQFTDLELGVYFLAFQISHFLLVLRPFVNRILLMNYSRNIELNSLYYLRIFDINSFVYSVPVLILVGYFDYFSTWILGKGWEMLSVIFPVMLAVAFLKATTSVNAPFLYSKGKSIQDVILAITNLILLAVFVYIGALYFKLIGVAYAVLLTYVILTFIGYKLYIKPLTGISFFRIHGFSMILIFIFLLYLYCEEKYLIERNFVYRTILLLSVLGVEYYVRLRRFSASFIF